MRRRNRSKSEKLRWGEVVGCGRAHKQEPLGYKTDKGMQSGEELLCRENAVDQSRDMSHSRSFTPEKIHKSRLF